jgi:hypothetical protein
MSHWEEFERRIRERGVRVEQRLGLLAKLREADAGGESRETPSIAERRKALLDAVGELAQKIKGAL